ncbi:hypothetical protein A8B79_12665 [Balneola sp. EhC07]|uniref:hypothetical protein n=1 Tax=Balneola sp. EhC07 TaxID=1849360 RepID=UPI0007F526EF|nr:hypothetical protein [Balneola sp. EhC07]OAN64193.1 hypothetical protein A8B79_12665 [Balneola sp. EhC07]
MAYRSVLIISILAFWGCSVSKLSYEQIRDNHTEFIEVNIGSSIFSSTPSRAILLSDRTLVTEKRNVFGSKKVKSEHISSFMTDSLFSIVKSQYFKSLPQNVDDNCTISYQDENQEKKNIGGTITDQPLKSIRYSSSSTTKTIKWKECRSFSDYEMKELKNELGSEDEFESLVEQNEQITKKLEMLNNLHDTVLSLNE